MRKPPFSCFLISLFLAAPAYGSKLLSTADSTKKIRHPAERPSHVYDHPRGCLFIYWGYNKAYYSKSNIHFAGPDYNFTLHRVRAHDRPTPFSIRTYCSPTRMWIPQYNYRIGYYFKDSWKISLGVDHMKYVVVHNQQSAISGYVSPAASLQYQGTYENKNIVLSDDFLLFEHTDGFNLLSADADHSFSLRKFLRKPDLSLTAGLGAGVMIPKTYVLVFGEGLDNRFHIAGYSVSAKLGLKMNFLRHFFFSCETRGGYARLPSVLVKNDAPERADHSVFYSEFYAVVGTYIRLMK